MALWHPLFKRSDRLQAAARNDPAMAAGESGRPVVVLQLALDLLGFRLPRSREGEAGFDGIYGSEVEGAVRKLQRRRRLAVDGVAGMQVLTHMDEMLRRHAPPAASVTGTRPAGTSTASPSTSGSAAAAAPGGSGASSSTPDWSAAHAGPETRFGAEACPHRAHRSRFIEVLREAADVHWTRVEKVPGQDVFIGGQRGLHVRQGLRAAQRTGRPSDGQRSRVEALLETWSFEAGSTRYLDWTLVKQLESRFELAREATGATEEVTSVELASALMPHATRHLHVALDARFRSHASPNQTYDGFFSRLLDWDLRHLFGLVVKTIVLNRKAQASPYFQLAYHPVHIAANNWLVRHRQQGIYRLLALSTGL